MKQINQFINEYIVKKKLDKFVDSEDHYEYFPETKEELIKVIQMLLDKGETDLNCIDTSKITDMSELFYNKEDINIDVSKWNVSNVEDMNRMFYNCGDFNCDLSNWDVSKVENMERMFHYCEKFNCDLSNWNVSKVKNMSYMFCNCYNFNSDLSNWKINKCEDFNRIFANCKNFNFEYVESWGKNIKTWINKDNMFYGMKNKPSWYEE